MLAVINAAIASKATPLTTSDTKNLFIYTETHRNLIDWYVKNFRSQLPQGSNPRFNPSTLHFNRCSPRAFREPPSRAQQRNKMDGHRNWNPEGQSYSREESFSQHSPLYPQHCHRIKTKPQEVCRFEAGITRRADQQEVDPSHRQRRNPTTHHHNSERLQFPARSRENMPILGSRKTLRLDAILCQSERIALFKCSSAGELARKAEAATQLS